MIEVREVLVPTPISFDYPLPIGPMPEIELVDLDADRPISGTPPVDLATVPKTAAIHYAHTALGTSVPAPRVIEYLAEQGVTVSESLVRKARKQVAEATATLPAWLDPTGEHAAVAGPAATLNGRHPSLTAAV